MDPKKFGRFVQRCRKELGMTQAQLAERIGVTDKAISRWERGVGFPDISLLDPLASALDITVVELMRSERTEQDQITIKEAESMMVQTIDLAAEQERFKVRGRLLKWLAIPAVYLLNVGMLLLIMFCVQLPPWARFLTVFVISAFFSMVQQGIRYIADCRYLEEPKKIDWPRKAASCVSVIGFFTPIFAMLLNTDGLRQYYFPVTMLGVALMFAWPMYEVVRKWRKKPDEE